MFQGANKMVGSTESGSDLVGGTMNPLTPKQVAGLTGKKRPSAQVRVLRYMGIDHRTRPDGSILVVDVDVPMTFQKEVKITGGFKING